MTDTVPIFIMANAIKPNPYQPPSRLKFTDAQIKEMAVSIMENGLMQNPIVRNNVETHCFEMADGWLRNTAYRWLAEVDKLALYSNIPVLVRDITDRQMAEMVLEANTKRVDLTAVDLAHLYKKMQEQLGITEAEIAKKHNCSQGEIANTIRLLQLPEHIQQMIISQEITETHGRYLLPLLANPVEMDKLAARVRDEKLTVSALDFEIKLLTQKETKPRATVQIERNATPPAHTPAPKPVTTKTAESSTKTADSSTEKPESATPEPPAAAPVPVTTTPRKLTLNENETGVFAGIAKMGVTPFMKQYPGKLETIDIPGIIAEAEAYWKE